MSIIQFIRSLKFPYLVYNFFNRKKLKHNIPLYRKLGLNKKYYSSISSKDFAKIETPARKFDLNKIKNTFFYKNLSSENRASIEDYDEKGYLVIRNYLKEETVDQINHEISRLLEEKKIKFRYRNKLMFAIHHSALLRNIAEDKIFTEFLSLLMDGKTKLFQSINFIMGSQQKTHSDSIHMTTYPLGGLLGVWIALEDVDESNGALHYIPGSHKLPYFLNSDYDNEGTPFKIGGKSYTAYEEFLDNKLKELGLKKEIFRAKKGDMLIWHANILHGGEPHADPNKTRKSMVFHYFDEESICYHEVTQRPALFEI